LPGVYESKLRKQLCSTESICHQWTQSAAFKIEVDSLLLGKLSEESLNEVSLWHGGEVWLLGRERLAHGLRLLDGNLGGDWLRDGQRSSHLEVLGVPVLVGEVVRRNSGGLNWLRGDWLDQSVVDLRLLNDDGSLNWSRLDNRSLVGTEKLLTSLLSGLLLLGSGDEVIDGGGALSLLWGGLGLDLLLLALKLLHDLLALLARGNASVRVVQESVELVKLLKVSVVGLGNNVVVHADSEGGNETEEGEGTLQVLLVLSVGLLSWLEERVRGGVLGRASVLELVGLLGKHLHGNVVGTSHGGLSWHDNARFAAHASLSEIDEKVVSVDLSWLLLL